VQAFTLLEECSFAGMLLTAVLEQWHRAVRGGINWIHEQGRFREGNATPEGLSCVCLDMKCVVLLVLYSSMRSVSSKVLQG
jgi:hypothetical protein